MSRHLEYGPDGEFIGMGQPTTNLDAGDDDSLDGMTVAELRDHAEANDIDLGDATKKADIIAAIERA